jgi:branched-chain amino acid transport system ATP-binding protein
MKISNFVQDHPVPVAAFALLLMSGVALAVGVPMSRITEVAIYALYGAGVNLLVGYTGLVPFGASVFFGTASYVAALFAMRIWGVEIAGLAMAVVFSMVMGLVIGSIILRRRGLYFSLLTLACSQLAFEVAFKWTDVTGGENGLQNLQRPWFTSSTSFHVFVLATVVVALYMLWRIAHSPFGRTLQAIRDNEQRTSALGYDTYRLKLAAFTLAGGFIGYAGGLLAFLLQGVYANNLNWQHAADALLMTVLGGVHHFLGPLWGAAAFIVLSDQLSAWIEQWWLAFAPILIVFVLLSPEGIHGFVQRLRKREFRTLVRSGIPARPVIIKPWIAASPQTQTQDEPLLSVRGLGKRFGQVITARDIDLDIMPRQLHSFIGPNGAGKTTFFNILTGLLQVDTGSIVFRGKDITRLAAHLRVRAGIGRSFQIISLFKHLSAFENVRLAVQSHSPSKNRLWRDAYGMEQVNDRTWSLLAAVGLEDRAEIICINLSHGEQRLLDIAVALASDGELLLLDEPLAGLADADREVVGRLIRSLAYTHAVLLIEHDIDRVLALSDRITVLHQGRLIADGAPAHVATNEAVISAYMGKSAGRNSSAKQPVVAAHPGNRAGRPAGPALLDARNLVTGYDGSQILHGLDLTVRPGEVVALLGRNGVGKTTLLRALTGTLPLSSGSVHFAGKPIHGLQSYEINLRGVALVPEGRRLFPNLSVQENLELAMRPGGASLQEAFALFPKIGTLRHSRAENLSGGERQMVAIARALMAPAQLILLDEPFEGLAPAVVDEVMAAVLRLRERAAILIVEHKAELILPICDHAFVLVNGAVAWQGSAADLDADAVLQQRLLGVATAA